MSENIRIRKAVKTDAPHIAKALIMALGPEIPLHLAGSKERLALVDKLFTELAEADNSQYSYLNSLIAENAEEKIAGAIISYDGAQLHRLRPAFCAKANQILGTEIKDSEMHDETTPDEIYLDSLAVFPGFRGQGIARLLISAAIENHKDSGKPVALLCDPENENAFNLYTRLGFVKDGMRPFADTMMNHMILKSI